MCVPPLRQLRVIFTGFKNGKVTIGYICYIIPRTDHMFDQEKYEWILFIFSLAGMIYRDDIVIK